MRVFYPKINFDKKYLLSNFKNYFYKNSPLHNSNFNKYFILKIFKEIYFHQIVKFP